MTVAEPILVRWGAPLAGAADPAAGHLSWPDLAPDQRADDWLELLRRLNALPAGRPVLLVRAGVWVASTLIQRLLAAAEQAGDDAIVAALDNFDPDISPLPTGTVLPAPLDVAALDRLCAWLGQRLLIPRPRLPLAAALWPAGFAGRLLAADWQVSQPLPDGMACFVCDHALAADPNRPLQGPDSWKNNEVPPPTSPLEHLRSRWPVERDSDPLLPAKPLAPLGPVPGLDPAPVVLHVCHGWGGGSERFIRDLARADTERCHLLLSAHGSTPRQQFGEWLELRPAAAPDLLLARYALSPAIADTAQAHGGYSQILSEVIARWQVDALMVSSLIGHGLAALDTRLPTVVVGHDYYPLWPQLHCDFGDPARRFDRAELDSELALAAPTLFAAHDTDYWWRLRQAYVEALLRKRPRLAVPTRQVHDNCLRMAPELAELDWSVLAHGIERWPQPVPPKVPVAREGRLRVLVPGRIAGGKGLALLKPLSQRLDRRCELVLLGAGTTAAELHGQAGIHILADYARDELPGLIAGLAPDLALLPATVAETYGYLLSELQSLGLPVLATAIGSYAERIDDGRDGLLVAADANAIATRLHALLADPSPLAAIRTHLADHPTRDSAAMAADYRRLLPLPPVASARAGLREPDWRDARDAWWLRRGQEIDRQRLHLHRRLRASEHELNARAAWGFDLDRQLRTSQERVLTLAAETENLAAIQRAASEQHEQAMSDRMDWIANLKSEIEQLMHDRSVLQARSDELDRVHRSRSWRFMAPLRWFARQLRGLRARLGFKRRRLINQGQRLRLSLASRGLIGTVQRWRQRRHGGSPDAPLLVPAPTATVPPAHLPTSAAPEVSIIIPTYGKLAYTCACLASLVEHAGPTPFEVIVIDDAAPDGSAEALAGVDGLRLLRNPENLGFVGSCNAGAAAALGRWLVFLNNDTTVTAGWLEALLTTPHAFTDAGLIGARLLYPDGRLQEAGGLVFSDGSGWNYGRFDDPADPRYRYARETDYCSGAAILIESALFQRLGGFDARYAPAYYEDTDLAFKVRAAGLKVIVQPAATVIHHEGVTAGTDTRSGIKRYQVVNQTTFLERWREVLDRQPAPGGDVEAIVRQRAHGRILVIDATTPEPDQDSGSVRLTHLLHLLRASGRHVTFFADNRAYVPGYSERLQQLGIEVLYHPWLDDPVAWLRRHGPSLDAVVVCRHYIASSYLDLVRRYAPRARFIFDTVDLHYLREERAAALAGSDEIARQAARTRSQELRLIRAADVTLVVSPVEQALLAQDAPGARVEVLSNVHPVPGCRRGFSERADLFFVGGFQHPPNIDAVTWFVSAVFPAVRAALPEIRFHIIGSKMPPAVRALAGAGVQVHGHVEDLEPFLDSCRIALAPLRYGAGVKGKVNLSMSYGQPVVATGMAVEGMHLVAGEEVLVADTPADFAAAVVRLYSDERLWQQLSNAGMDNVRRHFSFDTAAAAITRIFAAGPQRGI